jgi:parvulin-like peptidyl-prolyl isomerase
MLLTAALALAPIFGSIQDPAPQLPDGLVAQWESGQLTEKNFAEFLGRTFKNKELGNDALRHLLQIQLVELEADRRSLTVPPELLEERLEEARKAAEAEGYELEKLVVSRGLTMKRFRKLLGDSVLHEMMARQDLDLKRGQAVTSAQLQQWTDERLNDLMVRAKIAPEAFAIHASPYIVTTLELGKVIADILDSQRKQEYLEQLVLEAYMPTWAKTNQVILTDDILEAEIDWRRRRVTENPAYGGATYEGLLQTQGATLESVRQGTELRLVGLLRLYSRVVYGDTWFDALDEAARARLEGEYGTKRRVSWMMIRAVEEKRTEIDLDFVGAAKELDIYAARAQNETQFAQLAERYSEDENSRKRSGELGWISRESSAGIVDPALSASAFRAPIGSAYGPFRVSGGMGLVWVHEERDPVSEEAFRDEVRRGRHVELRKRVLETIKLRTRFQGDFNSAITTERIPVGGGSGF